MLRVEFQTSPSGTLEQLDASLSDGHSIELENAFYADDGEWIETLLVSAATPFDPAELLAPIDGADLYHQQAVPTGSSERTVYRVTVTAYEPYPFILGLILQRKAIPNRVVLRHRELDAVVTVREWESFRTLADEVQERFGRFELVSVNQVESPGEPLGSGRVAGLLSNELSAEQLTVLETAYSMGYFEIPRGASASEIAGELDVAQSTLSERLRTAEQAMLELVYGARGRGTVDPDDA